MKRPRQPKLPSKPDLLDLLEALEVVLSGVIRRWNDGIAPEVRDEIAIEAYQPVLRMLIRARRRPMPR